MEVRYNELYNYRILFRCKLHFAPILRKNEQILFANFRFYLSIVNETLYSSTQHPPPPFEFAILSSDQQLVVAAPESGKLAVAESSGELSTTELAVHRPPLRWPSARLRRLSHHRPAIPPQVVLLAKRTSAPIHDPSNPVSSRTLSALAS